MERKGSGVAQYYSSSGDCVCVLCCLMLVVDSNVCVPRHINPFQTIADVMLSSFAILSFGIQYHSVYDFMLIHVHSLQQ